jgi:MFS transporter, LPLT family, lysophospholipid transporter
LNASSVPAPLQRLWSRGLVAVLCAQFLSAMADNALLFGALALLKADHYPAWTAPLLQEFFVGAYIFLAPFAGPFSDSFPKGRVMLISNLVKLAGAAGMLLGLNPFVAYGLVGVGAATYSPAKYGILSELTSPAQLVKANGLMESSTIAAILIGAVAGGTLADWNIPGALAIVAICYGAATAANLLIPHMAPEKPMANLAPGPLIRSFSRASGELIRIPDARFSVIGTSLFWGTGSTMRFLLVAWVPVALGVTTNRMPAYLNAAVAVGIVVGAALAARFVTIDKAARALPAGVLIGVALCLMAGTQHIGIAFALMVAIGTCGGFFVVPLNALLQERGHESVGAGNAIAFQNFWENALMLVMIGLYTLAVHAGVSVRATALAFGISLSLTIAGLWWQRVRKRPGSGA